MRISYKPAPNGTGKMGALMIASLVSVSAEVAVTYDNGNPGYGGLTIQQASSTDYLQGKMPIYTDGTLFDLASPPVQSAPFLALTDGIVQINNDDVTHSVFFSQSGAPPGLEFNIIDGRILFDLGSVINISRIDTYSWHSNDRNAQNYSVYGGVTPFDLTPAAADGPPDTLGYSLIGSVLSTPSGVGNAQGVSIADSLGGHLGGYRYLLFQIHPSTTGNAATNTFFGEIDVLGTAAPDENAPAVTSITRDESGNVIIGFTGRPNTTHRVTKSPDLLVPFAPLTLPLSVATNTNGVGQAVVPASEASEPREFYRIEMIPALSARTQIAALNTGQGNFFDSQTFDPTVMVNPEDPTQLIMFFSGMAAPVQYGIQRIGRATAEISDPTTWTVSNGGQPVLVQSATGWDSGGDGLRCDSVLYNPEDQKLYLYYTAHTSQVGLATSSDLGMTWEKQGSNPVLSPSGDENHNSQFAVIKDGNAWHGYYSYRTPQKILPAYRYASSSDGRSWTKSHVDIYSDGGRYMEYHQFFKISNRYYLAYESGGTGVDWDIRVASSTAPDTGWVRSSTNPYFVKSGGAGTFDRFHVSTPCFIEIGGKWWLFYSGAKDVFQPYGTNHWPMGVASDVSPFQ